MKTINATKIKLIIPKIFSCILQKILIVAKWFCVWLATQLQRRLSKLLRIHWANWWDISPNFSVDFPVGNATNINQWRSIRCGIVLWRFQWEKFTRFGVISFRRNDLLLASSAALKSFETNRCSSFNLLYNPTIKF